MNRLLLSIGAAAGVLGGTAILPDAVSSIGYAFEKGRAEASAERLANEPRGAFASRIRTVSDALRPSVVQIRPTRFVERGGDAFFGMPSRQRREGVGSGVIVSSDGYVLTNNHVVRGATSIRVVDSQGKSRIGKVIGTDPLTDLAVVKIDGKGLRAAKLGDSDAVRVGDWVVAAGSPFGLAQSVTAGIVSGKGRSRVGVAQFEDFIQTDAAVNPGNSGGPLADLDGNVIGINTAIASRTGAYNGISFAIPSKLARRVMDDLIAKGRVERGWLGVYIRDREDARGVTVENVVERGPAALAGIRRGDVILSIEGREMRSVRELSTRVAELAIDRRARVVLERAGKRHEIEARIMPRPPERR